MANAISVSQLLQQISALRTQVDTVCSQIEGLAEDAELGRRMRAAMHEMTATRPNGIASSPAHPESTPPLAMAPPAQEAARLARPAPAKARKKPAPAAAKVPKTAPSSPRVAKKAASSASKAAKRAASSSAKAVKKTAPSGLDDQVLAFVGASKKGVSTREVAAALNISSEAASYRIWKLREAKKIRSKGAKSDMVYLVAAPTA